MWLASLKGGGEIIAEGADLPSLYAELNELDLADGAEITVIWTGDGAPPEMLEML